MICSIHQPNFMPWLGYFNKIYRADIFCLLDCVSYPKSSKTMSSWENRVAIRVGNNKNWINCPVIREEGTQYINQIKINSSIEWKNKLLKTIMYNYKKTPYYEEIFPFLYDTIMYDATYLSEYNINFIKKVVEKINIDTKIVRQSDLNTSKHSTELLIEIVKKLSCDSYMCGGGASGYQEDELFEKNSIDLVYQNYKHPEYPQNKEGFIAGLSIIDVLFNCGFIHTERIVKEK